MKRLSAFSVEFWMNKGMSEDEAIHKTNSMRPIRKEYWMNKGMSEDEAIQKAIETKTSNNKKGAKASSERSEDSKRRGSVRCVEYWMNKGMSEDEAKIAVSDKQKNFSLEICVEKHGIVEGIKIWQDRQDKWQNTLRSKSKEEIDFMNSKKSSIKFKESIDETIKHYYDVRKMKLFNNIEEYIEYNKNINFSYIFYPVHKKIEKIGKLQYEIFLMVHTDDHIKNTLHANTKYDKFIVFGSKKVGLRMWVGDSLLRSSYEIYFYDKFKELYPNIDISIDKRYPNSNMRYDFMIKDDFIEICPEFHNDELYKQKIIKKQNLFCCRILVTKDDIDNYLENLNL